jgi:chlorobactene glucosyltransferase
MLFYQSIITVVLALLLLNTILNLRWLSRPPRQPLPAPLPLVSILVPARNEARAIARCVTSLAQQDYPRYEIFVLDDNSEDETAAIVSDLARRYPAVRLLRGQPLPAGWHGKAYACAQLAQAAQGEWLLFVDADTVHAPDCLSTAMRAAYDQQADLLTLLPRIEIGSAGEALLLPVILLTFGTLLPLGLVARWRWPLLAGALGPFMLFRRASYVAIGGHAAVRTDIVEDMQLSRLVKRHGGRVVWRDGSRLMRIRFYHSSAEAWRGLAKSTFTALDYSLPALAVGLPAMLALFVAPYAFLIAGIAGRHDMVALVWLPLAQILCIWLAQLALAERFHLPRGMAFLNAVTMLAVGACTLAAAYQSLRGAGVTWKGRTYQFRPQPSPAGRQTQRATQLALARCALAGMLLALGWHGGEVAARDAALLVLVLWSVALLEQAARKHAEGRWTLIADSASAAAGFAYLALAGLIASWPVALAALVTLASARWYGWRGIATTGMLASGGVLLLAASWPALHAIFGVWLVGVLLLERHTLAQNVGAWLHRPRSS